MDEQIVSTAARIAALAGQWWVAIAIVLGGAVLIVLARRYGGVFGVALKAVGSYFHGIKPEETTLNPDGSHKEGTGMKPIDIPPGGAPLSDDNKPKGWE